MSLISSIDTMSMSSTLSISHRPNSVVTRATRNSEAIKRACPCLGVGMDTAVYSCEVVEPAAFVRAVEVNHAVTAAMMLLLAWLHLIRAPPASFHYFLLILPVRPMVGI